MKLTQRDRILDILRAVPLLPPRDILVPYLTVVGGERWISSRYFKQQLLISECNGRISELRADGYDIATLEGVKDQYGFAYHRLVSEPPKISHILTEEQLRAMHDARYNSRQ